MLEKNLLKEHRFRSTYLLGMVVASAIIGVNCPALADDHVADSTPTTVVTNNLPAENEVATPQTHTETVTVQRKIVFHFVDECKDVYQTSHAHRQVTIDPVTKKETYSAWTVDPFDKVEIPQVKGLECTIDEIPTVVHIKDLSYFKHQLDVFYHPTHNKVPTTDDKDKVTTDTSTQTDPLEPGTNKQEMVDSATNTNEVVTSETGVQTTPQLNESISTDTSDLVGTKDEGVGDDSPISSELTENSSQTENPTTDKGVGDEEISSSVDEGIQVKPEQEDQGTNTEAKATIDHASGDDSVINATVDDGIQTDTEEKKSLVDESSQTEKHMNDHSTMTDDITVSNQETQTQLPELKAETTDEGTMTDEVSSSKSDESVGDSPAVKAETVDNATQTEPSPEPSVNNQKSLISTVDQATMTDQPGTKEASSQTEPLPQPIVKPDNKETSTELNQLNPSHTKSQQEISSKDKNSDLPQDELQAQSATDQAKTPQITPAELHNRLAASQEKISQLSNDNSLSEDDTHGEGKLPQTGNRTSTFTTLIGLSLTGLVAIGALFSMKKKR